LATTALLIGVLAVRADDPKARPAEAKDVPIEATLKANTDAYTLDLGGKTADDFRKALEDAEKTGTYPDAPKVDLVLELKNTSDKEVKVKVGGTTTVLELGLTGPAATTVMLKRRVTPKIVIPAKEVVLAPGKSVTVPIERLAFGAKGDASRAYWLEPGKYSLAASYKTWMSPAPKGASETPDGYGAVTLTSAATTVTVKGK
jgi:hypothetical protein